MDCIRIIRGSMLDCSIRSSLAIKLSFTKLAVTLSAKTPVPVLTAFRHRGTNSSTFTSYQSQDQRNVPVEG